ncbi:hypothetical protein DFP94_104106 [Fontibacillus phaseoli]|uniref:Uncharacterized protein n=1 Tax=Fontibacillus phaseoli TaxID=1416533 RepID=A0A369BIY0_9BACL|nr:hypothetical protein DFP94_104106 [Fontibacillus phaseoli]
MRYSMPLSINFIQSSGEDIYIAMTFLIILNLSLGSLEPLCTP